MLGAPYLQNNLLEIWCAKYFTASIPIQMHEILYYKSSSIKCFDMSRTSTQPIQVSRTVTQTIQVSRTLLDLYIVQRSIRGYISGVHNLHILGKQG